MFIFSQTLGFHLESHTVQPRRRQTVVTHTHTQFAWNNHHKPHTILWNYTPIQTKSTKSTIIAKSESGIFQRSNCDQLLLQITITTYTSSIFITIELLNHRTSHWTSPYYLTSLFCSDQIAFEQLVACSSFSIFELDLHSSVSISISFQEHHSTQLLPQFLLISNCFCSFFVCLFLLIVCFVW